MTSYVLWDIDGVLNPHLSWDLTPENGWERVEAGWAVWMLNAELQRPWLEELTDLAQQVWVSNWAAESNHVNHAFGLDDVFPHVPLQSSDAPSWKLPSVQAWVAANVHPSDKVVWVDDQLEEDAQEWAAAQGNVLLVVTDPSVGYTAEEHAAVLHFLRD